MTFPQTQADIGVELYLNSAWTDVTDWVRTQDGITVSRGLRDEGSRVEQSTCRFNFDNGTSGANGSLTPRNPAGTYYGQITRNTRARAFWKLGSTRMVLPGALNDYASTPDHASISITGDLDIRVDASLGSWNPRKFCYLLHKWGNSAGQKSFYLATDYGYLRFGWSADGTNELSAASTIPIPVPLYGRKAVRATIDVDNGAGGRTVTFYTSDTISGTWTQLGDPVTVAGTTSIFDSTRSLYAWLTCPGNYYAAQLRSGIGGSIVANPDFTIQSDGATSFADSAGRTWTVTNTTGAAITNRRYLVTGEIPSFSGQWDLSEKDITIPVEIAGVLRKLSQGSQPLGSTLYRALTRATGTAAPKAYWPMEEGSLATSFSSPIDGCGPLQWSGGTPDLGAFSEFKASGPLPTMASGVRLGGTIPVYTGTGDVQVRFLMNIPSGGTGADGVVCQFVTTGTVYLWVLKYYDSDGGLGLAAYDSSLTLLFDTTDVAFSTKGKNLYVHVALDQNGSNIDYTIATLEVGQSTGATYGGTLASNTISAATGIQLNASGSLDGAAFGHLYVMSSITSLFDYSSQLKAYAGETATARVERLCGEESVPVTIHGHNDFAETMGPQLPDSLLNLLWECEDVDGGILCEARDFYGLVYRARSTMLSQAAAAALDYTDLTNLAPLEDDHDVRNDITVTRPGGSSARRTLDSGALSVLDPPNGIGRYDADLTLNAETDAQVEPLAARELALRTVDEARYPDTRVELANVSTTLACNLLDLEPGDRITITNPPSNRVFPDTISQILLGVSLKIDTHTAELTLAQAPESPYRTAVADSSTLGRADTSGSTLASGVTSSATSLSVTTTTGPIWSTTASGYYLYMGGEKILVNSVSGASSPQTFSVTRSQNGVSKSHSAGAAIRLWQPAVAS